MMILSNLLKRRHRFKRRNKPGAQPGLVHSDPSQPAPEIHLMAYGPQNLVDQSVKDLRELPKLIQNHAVCWINVDGLGDGEAIKQLGEMFKLHPLALEDVVHVHQRAKVEDYGDTLFIVARMVEFHQQLDSEQISLFLVGNVILTFQEHPGGDCLDPVRERIRKARGQIRNLGPDYLAYALLDAIIDGYFPVLERIGDEVENLEGHISEHSGPSTLHAAQKLRGDLLFARKHLWPHRDAINSLLREPREYFRKDTLLYLRDCYDHVIQLIDIAEVYRELCMDLRDLYFSEVSHRTNEIMKVLTLIATIFIPLSFIAGLYGMNFNTSISRWNMPELNWVYGYPFALGLMGTVAGCLLIFFYRRGWIGREK